MLGIYWQGANKAGDRISRSSLPENYYKNTGDKLVDLEGFTFLENNPFVIKKEDIHPNTLSRVERRNLWNYSIGADVTHCKTMAHEICKNWGLEKCYLTSPRLYRFENSYVYPKTMVINTTGDNQGAMSLKILNTIREKYHDYLCYQIGGINDVDFNYDIDRRGMDFWLVAKLISESELYIGPDSFCHWIAKCYPRIRRKILLVNKNEERCENFFPRGLNDHSNPFDTWLECDGADYYNIFQQDYGITKSYLSL